jgi:hypothetical protein
MKVRARISKGYLEENPQCKRYTAGAMKCTPEYKEFDMSESELTTMKAKSYTVKKYDEKTKKTKLYKRPIIEIYKGED